MRSRYEITSAKTPEYNCIGWALGEPLLWYQARSASHYWPPECPNRNDVEGWICVFRIHEFELCSSAELELGLEKIAIYVSERYPRHVARQLESGRWTSKIGGLEDIE
jgi:hypothetical protein